MSDIIYNTDRNPYKPWANSRFSSYVDFVKSYNGFLLSVNPFFSPQAFQRV